MNSQDQTALVQLELKRLWQDILFVSHLPILPLSFLEQIVSLWLAKNQNQKNMFY